MKTKDKTKINGSALRKKAEKRLAAKGSSIKTMAADNVERLVHELQVHQIELEMQNDELRKAQEEIEASRSKYSDLYDFAPVGYFTFNSRGLILDANLTGAALLGIERNFLIKQPFSLYIAPEHRDLYYQHHQQVKRTGIRQSCEIKLVRKDGIQFYAQMESISEGTDGHCRSAVTDISERKQAEAALQQYREHLEELVNERTARLEKVNVALRESEERLALAANAAQLGIFDWNVLTGETMWTRQHEVIFGYTPTTTILHTYSDFANRIHPDDLPFVEEQFRRAMAERAPYQAEYRIVWPDGSVHWVAASGQFYYDPAGQAVRMLGTVLDITERKQAEQELVWHASFPMFSPVPIVEVDLQGSVQFANPAARQMFPDIERQGIEHAFLIDFRSMSDRCQKTGENFSREISVAGRWYYQKIYNVLENQRVRIYSIDFTERKNMEEALRRSHDELELRVHERTAMINKVNELLRAEIAERQRIHDVVVKQAQLLEAFFTSGITPLVFLDKNFNFIRVNDAYARACQRNAQDFPGRNHFDFYPHEENQRIFSEVVATGKTFQATAKPLIFPDHPEWGVTYWDWTLTPLPDENGAVVSLVFSLKDVTERVLADELQQKAAAEIHDLYNNAPCGYHSINADGTFVRINDTELSWLGYSRDEIIGKKKFSDLILGSDLELFKKSFSLFKERGIVHDLEFEMIRKDGSTMPVLVSATAILDEQGHYVSSRSSVFDITMRKRAEEALRESEERFRSLIHTAPVVIVSLAPEGTILEFNPEAELAYGRTRAEVLGRNYFDLFIPPEQHDMVAGAIKRVLAGEPISGYENLLRSADGTQYFYVWNIDRVLDTAGNPSAIIAVGHDVTERRKMLEALEAASAYTRSLIEASLDPLVTINRDGTVTDLNRATEQIANLPREQIIGTDFSDYFTEPEKARRVYQHVFKRGFVRDYPLAIKGRFGVVRDVLYNATVYRNRAGEIEGVFAAARDISKRKRAETRLRESEERLKFLSTRLLEVQEHERKSIACELHDSIASSLTAVILGLSRTRPAIEACDPQYRDIFNSSITMLQSAIDEARQLMNSLRPPMLDDFGLISSIRWFTEQYRALYPQLNADTEIAIEESLIPANLKIVLFRIIQEAFANIAKHSRAQVAQLYLHQKENSLDLVIADDGAGFDIEAVTDKQEVNRGLGILSMRERAELSGGMLSIDSAHGQGTVISASWPLQP